MAGMGRDPNTSAVTITPPRPVRKPYTPPRLDRFGTIRELTQGAGKLNNFDGVHPPGQNRSRL